MFLFHHGAPGTLGLQANSALPNVVYHVALATSQGLVTMGFLKEDRILSCASYVRGDGTSEFEAAVIPEGMREGLLTVARTGPEREARLVHDLLRDSLVALVPGVSQSDSASLVTYGDVDRSSLATRAAVEPLIRLMTSQVALNDEQLRYLSSLLGEISNALHTRKTAVRLPKSTSVSRRPGIPTVEEIRAVRAGTGLTQAEAAMMLGIDTITYQRYELNMRRMSKAAFDLFRLRAADSVYIEKAKADHAANKPPPRKRGPKASDANDKHKK